MDVLKQLIELQSQLVELSRRNAETEKSVAQLRHEVAQVRRHQTERAPATAAAANPQKRLLNALRTRLSTLPKALQKTSAWPLNLAARPNRSTAA